MGEATKYFVVKQKAIPEVLLKVVEAKRLLESEKVLTIQGILSDVLKIIAEYRANILTIHQSIPINGIASLTLSIQVLQTTGDISRMIEQLEGQTSVHHVKILAKE